MRPENPEGGPASRPGPLTVTPPSSDFPIPPDPLPEVPTHHMTLDSPGRLHAEPEFYFSLTRGAGKTGQK
ncbi:hypothetical protein SSAG_04197 [Streptomyces sp. Mg1]|nr:hypothetical protein SSAG_04197 [Streptomyces sp. Mg1]